MAQSNHVYDLTLSNGQAVTVQTPHHHDDHAWETFEKHLIDLAKQVLGGVLTGVIVHKATYKGRR